MRKEAKFFKIKSFSTQGKTYTVRKMPDGFYRCDCPHFVFRGEKCNHIRKIQKIKLKRHG